MNIPKKTNLLSSHTHTHTRSNDPSVILGIMNSWLWWSVCKLVLSIYFPRWATHKKVMSSLVPPFLAPRMQTTMWIRLLFVGVEREVKSTYRMKYLAERTNERTNERTTNACDQNSCLCLSWKQIFCVSSLPDLLSMHVSLMDDSIPAMVYQLLRWYISIKRGHVYANVGNSARVRSK